MATSTSIEIHLDDDHLSVRRGGVHGVPPYVVINLGADVSVFAEAADLTRLEDVIAQARIELEK
jgi:hypothetical protein